MEDFFICMISASYLNNNIKNGTIMLKLLDGLVPWLCQTPAITTYRVNRLRTTTESFKRHVEGLLKQRYKNPPHVFTLPDLPEVVCIEPSDVCSGPTYGQKEIVVDSCCGAAVLRGAHIYAIGVLSMESGTKTGDIVNVFTDLAGKCKKGLNVRFESEQKMFLGQGKVLMQRYQIYRSEGPLQGIAVEMISTISGVPSIGDLSNANALLQNLPSIICGRILDPQENELILDMCSAPGNKTTHLAELINDRGVIIALDKTEAKIKLVKEKMLKNDLRSIKSFAYDSTKSFSDKIQENSPDFKPPFKAETFDRILLDAPCSALGNRPMLSSSMTPKMLDSYPKVQKKLFANAVPMLKAGGTLVYSTCTVNISENEEIVVWALKTFPELMLEPSAPTYGGTAWTCDGLQEFDLVKMQRFGPVNLEPNTDTVGFFIAKFRKKI